MIDLEEILENSIDLLTHRESKANKGTYRKLLVIAGSNGMAGAAYMASYAAFRTGIGMVRIAGPECNRLILQTKLPEAMYSSLDPDGQLDTGALKTAIDWADYVILGPGLSRSGYAEGLMDAIYSGEIVSKLQEKELLVIDADALNIIADSGREPGALCSNSVITPHIGEMSRLTGLSIAEIKKDPQHTAVQYHQEHGVIVVLKDAVTNVAINGECIRVNSGCGAMAKAGSGDVLCGFIAGVTAVLKGRLSEAVPVGVWAHGRAGSIAAAELGCHSILATEIADHAAEAFAVRKNTGF